MLVFVILLQVIFSPVSIFAESRSNDETKKIAFPETSQTNPIKDYEDVIKLQEVTEETIDPQSLAVDEEGVVHYGGEPLFVGNGDDKIPAKLQDLMKEGVTQKLITEKKVSFLERFTNSILAFISPKEVKASDSAPVIKYNGSITFGRTTVGDFTIDGVQAFCIEHSKSSPASNTPYNSVRIYDNDLIEKALYYGWNGPKNIFTNRAQGIVITSSVLSRIYSGEINGANNDGYDELWDKVQNGSLPNTNFKLSDSALSISVSGNKQVSQSTTLNADITNSITFNVPSSVTVVNESTGGSKKGGSVTIKGGNKFHLEAPLNYGSTYSSGNLSGSMQDYQPIIAMPKSSGYQTLGFGRYFTDPSKIVSFTVPFKVQESKITVEHRDEYNNSLLGSTVYTKTIGSSYEFAPNNPFDKDGNHFVPVSTQKITGTVGTSAKTITFYYNLQREITVLHKDNRDGKLLKEEKKNYLRGQSYSYSPLTNLKKGTYTYRPVSTAKQTGTVGSSNITLTFYYDVPLIKAGLKKIQIYTAPAKDGLPVKVSLSKENIYPDTVADMIKEKLKVNLYQGTTLVDSKEFTAKTLPNSLDMKIQDKYLSINSKKAYTVKIEGFKPEAIDIPTAESSLSTDGYTSAETTISVHSNNQTMLDYKGVVMTEREVGKEMKTFFETLRIPVVKMKKVRTGYGFEMPIEVTYQNEIGIKAKPFSFNMVVPEEIVDKTYIEYPVQNKQAAVTMEETKHTEGMQGNTALLTSKWELPFVSVEKETGYLFSEQQIANKDSRIRHDMRSKKRKFYLPIWGYIGDYPVTVESKQAIGVNQVKVKIDHNLNVFAHMYAHMDSPTVDKDAILLEPFNPDDPFPNGVPSDWSEEEVETLKSWGQEELDKGETNFLKLFSKMFSQ